MNPWSIILTTALLAAFVAFFVSGVIHVMCLVIRRFTKEEPVPVAVVAEEEKVDHDAEIAVAIAAARAFAGRTK